MCRGDFSAWTVDFDRSVEYCRPIGRTLTSKGGTISTRDRLLDAAEELFATNGLAGVSIADVAQRAGLGKASVFHHFATKDHLYCAVIAQVLDDLDTCLTRSLALGGPPTQRLDRWIDTLIDTLGAHPTYPRLLLRVLVEEAELPAGLDDGSAAQASMNRIGTSMLRLLREGTATGEFCVIEETLTLQALIGATVHPLATGRFGEALVGDSLFSPAQLEVRKSSIKALIHSGIANPESKDATS